MISAPRMVPTIGTDAASKRSSTEHDRSDGVELLAHAGVGLCGGAADGSHHA